MKWKTKFGHLNIGKGRIIREVGNEVHLDCGCILKRVKRIGHIWTMELDFSLCRDHKCSKKCNEEE